MELQFAELGVWEKEAEKLYKKAFPREERPPFGMLKRRARQGKADFCVVLEGDAFVGITFVVGNDKVKTLMFLAIAEKARNGGYGSRILKLIRRSYPDVKLFINIEPLDEKAPNYQQRCRRKAFYEKNGLTSLDYSVREAGVTFEMMTWGEYVTREEYEETMEVMYGHFLYKIVKRM